MQIGWKSIGLYPNTGWSKPKFQSYWIRGRINSDLKFSLDSFGLNFWIKSNWLGMNSNQNASNEIQTFFRVYLETDCRMTESLVLKSNMKLSRGFLYENKLLYPHIWNSHIVKSLISNFHLQHK